MSKTKWNYAVVKSIFGDLWIGKTKLPIETNRVFDKITDAIYKAEMLFEDRHPDFDVGDEEDNDMELQSQYDSIVETSEDEVEVIRKKVEKFIV